MHVIIENIHGHRPVRVKQSSTNMGFPINVLGIKIGNHEKKSEKRKNSRDFVEGCGYIPSFNVSVGVSLALDDKFLRVLACTKNMEIETKIK